MALFNVTALHIFNLFWRFSIFFLQITTVPEYFFSSVLDSNPLGPNIIAFRIQIHHFYRSLLWTSPWTRVHFSSFTEHSNKPRIISDQADLSRLTCSDWPMLAVQPLVSSLVCPLPAVLSCPALLGRSRCLYPGWGTQIRPRFGLVFLRSFF